MKRALLLTASLLCIGCMSWSPGWELETPVQQPKADANLLIAEGRDLFDRADTKQHLLSAISAWEQALLSDPDNPDVLADLSQAQLLLGAAYAQRVSDKAEHYRQAIRYSERAMATNQEFRRQVESGSSVSEAAHHLGAREMRPMVLWVTGVSYFFKECKRGLGHVVNFRWMRRAQDVMDRMMEIDPHYENGIVLFSQGIYYIGLPKSVGGDRVLAADFLNQAIEVGGESLLPRWGRAKYFHVKTGDARGFREDLEWVLAQDPKAAASPYSWNVYFPRDARAMLASTDRLFSKTATRDGG